MTTGETLKKFRQLKGLKQQTIARKLKISQQAYAKVEQQKNVTRERLLNILRSINCSLKEWEVFERFILRRSK